MKIANFFKEKIFIADAMLGRLAKWMRIIGCDVEYFPKISDNEISERAFHSGRIILTRDTMLIRRKINRENCLFVKSDHYQDQLKQVVKAFSINPMENLFTRCLLCNKKLLTIDKISVVDSVPEYVYYTTDNFKTCPSCNRFYWKATHKNNVVKQLKNIGVEMDLSEENIIIHKAEVRTKGEKYSGIVSLILVQKENGWTYEVEDMSHGNLPLTWRTKSPEKASGKLRGIYKDEVWDFKIVK